MSAEAAVTIRTMAQYGSLHKDAEISGVPSGRWRWICGRVLLQSPFSASLVTITLMQHPRTRIWGRWDE